MTLEQQARHALGQLNPAASPQTFTAQHGQQHLTCELAALDSLACAFTRLAVASLALEDASPDELKQVSEALSQRITYLLEPISPIEVDPEQCVVQLRSNPPQQGEGQSSYYELLVRRGGEVSLCRYTKPRGQPRQVSPAQVTREVLLRLIGDFSAVLE
jgi:hypothetical protein